VTVSIAADTKGICRGMARVNQEVVPTSLGSNVEWRGTNRMSSKVRPASGRISFIGPTLNFEICLVWLATEVRTGVESGATSRKLRPHPQ
jgi:hypothetical protein